MVARFLLKMKPIKNLTGLLCLMFPVFAMAQESISLAGKWRIVIDGNFKDWPEKYGKTAAWYKAELPKNEDVFMLNQIYFKNADFKVNDWITLPGSTDEAGIGAVLKESKTFTPGLERLFNYDGAFWVQREVTIPDNWSGKTIIFKMERLPGLSKVFWDDNLIGEDYGFAYPHIYKISKAISSGKHRLTVLINKDETRYAQTGHQVVNGNGTSWNGIVGQIELIAKNPGVFINSIQIYPDIEIGNIKVNIALNADKMPDSAEIRYSLRKKNDAKFTLAKILKIENDTLQTTLEMPLPVLTWDEFYPHLYELLCEIWLDGKMVDYQKTVFGMRQIATDGGNITINNKKVFLRGTLDCGSFPLTGYPAMSKDTWLSIMQIVKKYGLNHVRFHTWCPPQAAFEAADELGIYLQPELCGLPYSEINRILDTYGNHPSFCMLSLNNEAFSHNEQTRKIISDAKVKDSRHLYTCTTHPLKPDCTDDFYVSAWGNEKKNEWPFYKNILGITWGGGDVVSSCRFNLFPPETASDFSSEIAGINAPILAHEMGQYAMFPDFDEIPKYENGVLRNTNYQRIKNVIASRGLETQAKDFAEASGMFSAILYKEEIESIMRTPDYAGFQLLDLHDYQGQYISIVGILTDFWESKGLVSPEKHREYCNSVVILSKMSKRIWLNNETFTAGLEIANFSFNDLSPQSPEWQLLDENNKIIKQGRLDKKAVKCGGLTAFNKITFSLSDIQKPSKLVLKVFIPNTIHQNNWDIWVYNSNEKAPATSDIFITNSYKEAIESLIQGKKVLLLADTSNLKHFRESCFSTIFWNSIHKWPQKAHTMGILCNPKHPVFKSFPTDYYSNWQWWDITMHANAMIINNLPGDNRPLIQVIDSYIINEKLAYLWECKVGDGKLMVCSINLTSDMEKRPASRQLKNSIINYMKSANFIPEMNYEIEEFSNYLKNL